MLHTDVLVGLTLYSLAIGLASGYFNYVLTDYVSHAAPGWWYKFVDWWRLRFFAGKPFTCTICMAFWLPNFAWAFAVAIGCAPLTPSVLFFTGASFAIALLVEKLMARMDIITV